MIPQLMGVDLNKEGVNLSADGWEEDGGVQHVQGKGES